MGLVHGVTQLLKERSMGPSCLVTSSVTILRTASSPFPTGISSPKALEILQFVAVSPVGGAGGAC